MISNNLQGSIISKLEEGDEARIRSFQTDLTNGVMWHYRSNSKSLDLLSANLMFSLCRSNALKRESLRELLAQPFDTRVLTSGSRIKERG